MKNLVSVTLWLSLGAASGHAQNIQNQYYAGGENPLVKLGAERVMKTINYPDWFLWPAMSKDVRQQLVDDYTTQEFLVSFDCSAADAPFTKYKEAGQLLLDLLGTSTYAAKSPNGYILEAPTRKEINESLKHKVVPELVKPREGYELDSPSTNETASANGSNCGENGDEIKLLSKEIAYLAKHYNIPTGYKPPTAKAAPARSKAPSNDICSTYCAGSRSAFCAGACR